MNPTADQLSRLPRWARDLVQELTRERDEAREQRREWLEVVTPDTPAYLVDHVHRTYRKVARFEHVVFAFDGGKRKIELRIDDDPSKVYVNAAEGQVTIEPFATNAFKMGLRPIGS